MKTRRLTRGMSWLGLGLGLGLGVGVGVGLGLGVGVGVGVRLGLGLAEDVECLLRLRLVRGYARHEHGGRLVSSKW